MSKREYNRAYWAARPEEHQARKKADRQKHPERVRRNQRDWLDRLKAKAIEHLGGACASCGMDEVDILELDHLERRDGPRPNGFQRKEWIRASKGDTSGLQLLCPNCHARKTRRNLRGA